MVLFTFLQISLMSHLIRDSWILLFTSVLKLLYYVVLVEVHKENLASLRYAVGKKEDTLTASGPPRGLQLHFEDCLGRDTEKFCSEKTNYLKMFLTTGFDLIKHQI